MGEGREGDWECSGCRNRNYAFRSFCNRCKQPRLLVDTKTPADSKWLPRIGDWICTGCSNNNYASREKCKKCGQPKEVAAMPAIAMPGASLPTYANYFARAQGGVGPQLNMGTTGNSALQQSLPLNPNWLLGVADKYGAQSTPVWPLGGSNNVGFPYANNTNQLLVVPKGWRNGDWICCCGFHNYSSRAQCKKCNAPIPSNTPSTVLNTAVSNLFPNEGHGTKRLASEEFINEWDNKRLNAGDINNSALANGQQQSCQGFEQMTGSSNDQAPGTYAPYPSGISSTATSLPVQLQLPQLATMPTLLGKGAKQWRDGDWMCTNCNNHNYASRSHCNRCLTQRDTLNQPVSVP
ncbi:E3 SUMO-protein ligase RanBP2 isoform X2 [Telopea speciosissima]|uniref:E3 SUMO-protein ligase RanBP2 isoform X2 n=1 Tax=Telopea speciosissima TaxID=54955 RepID=UPI001CC6F149|nr:E3 SUMO-protein ligase RanBP2 isoform X2 [Telopea speciosissima]